jgi:hypothetical protein
VFSRCSGSAEGRCRRRGVDTYHTGISHDAAETPANAYELEDATGENSCGHEDECPQVE